MTQASANAKALGILSRAAEAGDDDARDLLAEVRSGQAKLETVAMLATEIVGPKLDAVKAGLQGLDADFWDMLAEQVKSGVKDVGDHLLTFCDAEAKALKHVRESRVALVSEHVAIIKDVRALKELLSDEEFERAMGRLERLAALCERMREAARDGWLDRTLLALMVEKPQ